MTINLTAMKTVFYFFILIGIVIVPDTGYAQLVSVSGYVKNIVTDKMLENAAVYENKSGIGTITNERGYYKLLLKPGKQHLVISNPGYQDFTNRFELSNDTIIQVAMKPDGFQTLELADGKKVDSGKTISETNSPDK